MFYTFLYPLHHSITFLNVLRYPSFRIVMSVITAGFITFFLYPWFIRRLQSLQLGQSVRDDGPKAHLTKQGTPTMGGLLILIAVYTSVKEIISPKVMTIALITGTLLLFVVYLFTKWWMNFEFIVL